MGKVQALKREGLRATFLESKDIMEKARDIGETFGIKDDPQYIRALGFVDVRCAAILTEQVKVFEKEEWATLEEVSQDCRIRVLKGLGFGV